MGDRTYSIGDRVRLAIDRNVEGAVIEVLPPVSGMERYRVFHSAGDIGEYYADQLMRYEEPEAHAGDSPDIGTFLANYAARKLTLKSYSSVFSLNAGKIKFIPYQFRPLKKIIEADRPRLLIADEVGVGKTIETGIILKEFERREGVEYVLIVCPKELTYKWQREMRSRFDEPFAIVDGAALDYCLREVELEGEWPYQYEKCIVGLEMIRREDTARKIMGMSEALRFDMLVLDEAHHVVNTASNSFAIIEYLAACCDISVFLSATPIQLKSRDLYALLNLLLPEEFSDERLFNEMAAPNRYLNGAIRNIRNSVQEGWQERAADEIVKVPSASNWARARYGNNSQLAYWIGRLSGSALSDEERMACLRDLENLHSFAHVINRTKRRDIGAFTMRDPITVEIDFSESEREFYNAAHGFEMAVYTAQHGELTAHMIMATIDRLMTSCLPAFVSILDRFIARGMLAMSEITDDIDADLDSIEMSEELALQAARLRELARGLPKRDSKTDRLLEIIRETVDGSQDGKLLVFSFFKHTLSYLEETVAESGARCAVITGDTPSDDRDVLRERFRLPKDDPRAIDVLLSSEVGCEGLDYEFCSRMVNYDIPWNPMKIEQRIGRIDRFGQKSQKVRIYNFVTNGTVEERIFFRCYERLGIFNATIGDLEGVLGNVEGNLTKLAFDLNLTDSQKAEKMQQSVDNAIRDAEEQREFESNSRDVFLMDLSTEGETVGAERVVQMALLQRLIVNFFAVRCPTARCEIMGERRVRLRIYKPDKAILLKKLVELKRARRVESASDQFRKLEGFLKGDAQVIVLDFDGSDETDDESLFISLGNPLVSMALQEATPPANQQISLRAASGILPQGAYSFACYIWEQKGYRNTNDIEVIVLDSRTGEPVQVDLASFEAVLLSSEDSPTSKSPEAETLDQLLFERQSRAKERLFSMNEETVDSKLAILDESYRTKIGHARLLASQASNDKIRVMREQQVRNLEAVWESKRDELESHRKADILVKCFATGTIEVA